MAKRWNKKAAAAALKKEGRKGDSDLVHVNRAEKAMLKRYGGSGSTNPKTGLKEFFGNEGGGDKDSNSHNVSGAPGKSSGSSDTGSQQTVPTASKAPLAKGQALSPGGSLGGASATDSLGDQGAAATPGDIPGAHAAYKPGDVPAVKGADAIGIGATVLGGASLGALRALSTAAGEGDPLADHMGKQVGWSGTGDEQGGRPGKTDQKLSGDTKAPAADGTPATSTSTTSTSTTSSSTGASAAGASDGGTVTVNPDGTVRTTDTSVAGLRAQRRYGAKTAGA